MQRENDSGLTLDSQGGDIYYWVIRVGGNQPTCEYNIGVWVREKWGQMPWGRKKLVPLMNVKKASLRSGCESCFPNITQGQGEMPK